MKEIKYVECQGCGQIHYIVGKKEAETLKKKGYKADGFSDRNMQHCSNCGSKKQFSGVTQSYANQYSPGGEIHPILLTDEKLKEPKVKP